LLHERGITCRAEKERKLDHGAWVVLRLLYPDTDIPVISMSVNSEIPPEQAYEVGKALSPLKVRDVLVIGSGGTVHNLTMTNMA